MVSCLRAFAPSCLSACEAVKARPAKDNQHLGKREGGVGQEQLARYTCGA